MSKKSDIQVSIIDAESKKAASKAKTTKAKGSKPTTVKPSKPLTRILTAPVIQTDTPPDMYAVELVKRINEDILDTEKKVGRPRIYTPGELWAVFVEYVEWMAQIPAKLERPFASGIISITNTKRALSLRSFYIYAGINRLAFYNYESKPEFATVTEYIRDVIFEQKFDGATRGEFDPNIIARDLGLGENLDITGRFDPSKKIKVTFGEGNINAPKKTK